MAINPNPTRNNKHTLYLAMSGAGKSQALKQNKAIPGRGVRLVIWDPDEDHQATRFRNLAAFKQALIKAIKSRKGFRLAYSGDNSKQNFETFCALVLAMLDGKLETFCIIEELTASEDSSGQVRGPFGQLLRQGRKYGLVLHCVAQRSAETPKTVYTQCQTKFIGMQDEFDIPTVAKRSGIKPERISALKPLQFLLKTPGPDDPKLIKLKYKK